MITWCKAGFRNRFCALGEGTAVEELNVAFCLLSCVSINTDFVSKIQKHYIKTS